MATVKFSDEMPKPTSIKGTDRFLISDGVTGEAKAPDFNQAKEYLNITGIEMEPLVGGTTSATALVVPNGPAGEQRTAEVSSGKWYDFGSGPVEASADRRWKSYWNGTSWVLKDMGELPQPKSEDWTPGNYLLGDTRLMNGIPQRVRVPSTTQEPQTEAEWEAITPSKKLVERFIGVENILKNSSFASGKLNWGFNEAGGSISIQNGKMRIVNDGNTNFSLTQGNIPAMTIGETYEFSIKIKKVSPSDLTIRAWLYNVANFEEFTLKDNEWKVLKGKFTITASAVSTFTLRLKDIASEVLVDSPAIYKSVANSIEKNAYEAYKVSGDTSKQMGFTELLSNNSFENDVNGWIKNDNVFTMSVTPNNELQVVTTSNANVGVLQANVKVDGAGVYELEIRLKRVSGSDFPFSIGTYSPTVIQSPLQSKSNDWETLRTSITLEAGNISSSGTVGFMLKLTNNIEILVDYMKMYKVKEGTVLGRLSNIESKTSIDTSWMPTKQTLQSPIIDYIQDFAVKYNEMASDVTIVEVGDSISTDLNWTTKRTDANERPPFCTEFNINSFIEEKLRWKEQRYRRYDYSGVFTEILGGGTSSVMSADTANWGEVGAASYLPLTKVIDGGTGSGVTFKMNSGVKRLGLIVHTDKAWASSTQVTIAEGSGKVEVYNGSAWVEANGYSTTFKEADTLATLGFYRDDAQRRLKFRSLTDLTEKTITVNNVGSGRFGYWGIETSTFEYMFTYICASKGSHNISKISRYEEWMVDAFNPDLIVWQLPILNHSFGVNGRSDAQPSSTYAAPFINKYNQYIGKGYLVVPFFAWAATYSTFVDTSGNFLNGKTAPSGYFVSCQHDAGNLRYAFNQINVPIIDLFSRITEVAINKSQKEGSNVYSSSLVGSGANGKTFTIDGIHLNTLGNQVVWNLLEAYLNL